MFLFLRLCSAMLSAFIFVVYMPHPAHLLYRLSRYYGCPSEYCESQWYWYDYRHWCGNGVVAQEYALYGDTAAAFIDADDPATRARALQASMFVYDWLNDPKDGPAIEAVKKATADPDPMVRDIAAKYSSELGITGVP